MCGPTTKVLRRTFTSAAAVAAAALVCFSRLWIHGNRPNNDERILTEGFRRWVARSTRLSSVSNRSGQKFRRGMGAVRVALSDSASQEAAKRAVGCSPILCSYNKAETAVIVQCLATTTACLVAAGRVLVRVFFLLVSNDTVLLDGGQST